MDPFYKQDIFFFVTTIAVIVVGLTLTVLMVYVIKILRDVKYIARKARAEADSLAGDIQDLRENVKREGFKAKHVASFFFNRFYKKGKK